MLETERIDGVGPASGLEDEARQHRVVGDAAKLHSRRAQHLPVVLDIVSGLGHSRVLEQLAQWRRGRRSEWRADSSHPAAMPRRRRGRARRSERCRCENGTYQTSVGLAASDEAHEVGIVRLPRGSLGVERDDRRLA